jgi:hypothetical protein
VFETEAVDLNTNSLLKWKFDIVAVCYLQTCPRQ